jgi:hypothetical protein
MSSGIVFALKINPKKRKLSYLTGSSPKARPRSAPAQPQARRSPSGPSGARAASSAGGAAAAPRRAHLGLLGVRAYLRSRARAPTRLAPALPRRSRLVLLALPPAMNRAVRHGRVIADPSLGALPNQIDPARSSATSSRASSASSRGRGSTGAPPPPWDRARRTSQSPAATSPSPLVRGELYPKSPRSPLPPAQLARNPRSSEPLIPLAIVFPIRPLFACVQR